MLTKICACSFILLFNLSNTSHRIQYTYPCPKLLRSDASVRAGEGCTRSKGPPCMAILYAASLSSSNANSNFHALRIQGFEASPAHSDFFPSCSSIHHPLCPTFTQSLTSWQATPRPNDSRFHHFPPVRIGATGSLSSSESGHSALVLGGARPLGQHCGAHSGLTTPSFLHDETAARGPLEDMTGGQDGGRREHPSTFLHPVAARTLSASARRVVMCASMLR
jgi:hypothetical protein